MFCFQSYVCRQHTALNKEVQRLVDKFLAGIEEPRKVHERLTKYGLLTTEFDEDLHRTKEEVISDLITVYLDEEEQHLEQAEVLAKSAENLQSKVKEVRKVLCVDSLQQTLSCLTTQRYKAGTLQPFTGKFLTFLKHSLHSSHSSHSFLHSLHSLHYRKIPYVLGVHAARWVSGGWLVSNRDNPDPDPKLNPKPISIRIPHPGQLQRQL